MSDGAALAKEMLLEARASVEQGWCQGASARDGQGSPVQPWSPLAAQWSAIGGLVAVWARRRAAASDLERAIAGFQLANVALLQAMGSSPAEWNDRAERTLEDVLAAFERACASLDEATAA